MNNKDIRKQLKSIRHLKIRYKIVCLLGKNKSSWLKKKNVFASFGNDVLYTPDTIPNNPKLIKFHNNIKIAAGVKFYEHDVINQVFRDMHISSVSYVGHKSAIEIFDNVFIGAYSIIIGNVKIGPNAIVGAGSVVTKDVPEGVIVAGNPAVVIGKFDNLLAKRTEQDKDVFHTLTEQYDFVWKNFYGEK